MTSNQELFFRKLNPVLLPHMIFKARIRKRKKEKMFHNLNGLQISKSDCSETARNEFSTYVNGKQAAISNSFGITQDDNFCV